MMSKLSWPAFTFAMLFGFTLQAADSPLSQISDEADVVIRIRSFDATVEKVAALANAVQPGIGDMVSQNAILFGPVISNPALAGVDRTKDFYLVLFVREEREPKALFAIPATDGAAMQKAIEEGQPNFESQVRENWVFYADKDHGVPEAVSATDSLATLLSKSKANAVFENSDIGLHVNVAHIADVYEAQIQEGRQKFEAGIQQGIHTPGVENAEAIVEILKWEADLAFQLLDEIETFTIGVTATDSELAIEDYIDFAADSKIAAFLKKQPTSKFAALSKLGAELPLYLGISADFAALGQATEKFTSALYQDDTVRQGMKDYMETLKSLQVTSAVMSFDLASGTQGLFRSSAFIETKAAVDLMLAARKFAATSKSIKIGEMTQETTLEPEAETIGTRKIDLLTIKQTLDPNLPGTQMQALITGIMFGPDGIQTRTTALADGFLQAQGGDQKTMEAALKAYDENANLLEDAREGLAEEAHLLLLFDLPSLVNNGMLAATTLNIPGVSIPFERAAVEELQIGHSYTAISAAGEEHAVRIKTKVPVEQFQGVLKLVEFLQRLGGGR
jgi:hypothetical protein